MSATSTRRVNDQLDQINADLGPTIMVRDTLRALADIRPEPPGPRAVALALARVGLVAGTDHSPSLVTGSTDHTLLHALRSLIVEGALESCGAMGLYRLTDYGRALYGPDLRQRRH